VPDGILILKIISVSTDTLEKQNSDYKMEFFKIDSVVENRVLFPNKSFNNIF